MVKTAPVLCPYCNALAELVSDSEVYRRGYGGLIYLCRPCKAWVGCHKGGKKPLGRLADAELRQLKIRGHELFDPLWKRAGRSKRSAAYRWLAEGTGIPLEECHFGMMDVDRAQKAIAFLEAFYLSVTARKARAERIGP